MSHTTPRTHQSDTFTQMAHTISTGLETLDALLDQATPIIRILGLDLSNRWVGKKKPGDPRNGPWFASAHEVLDAKAWAARAACLYFLTDGRGQLRYVGESKNRLADRWRMPPAECATTGRDLGNPFVFHNRAWSPMEAELRNQGSSAGPFQVSVLQGATLVAAVEHLPELRHLIPQINEGSHLAKLVQDWLCCNSRLHQSLWNVAGTGRGRKGLLQ